MRDVHLNIESILTERIGEPGKRLHTARSRKRSGSGGFSPVDKGSDYIAFRRSEKRLLRFHLSDRGKTSELLLNAGVYASSESARPVTPDSESFHGVFSDV